MAFSRQSRQSRLTLFAPTPHLRVPTAGFVEGWVASQCGQQAPSAYHQATPDGRAEAERVLDSSASCPIPEMASRGRTPNQWRDAFLAYFTTGGANNGGTEAITVWSSRGRVARGFRDRENDRLRMLLIGGGPTLSPTLIYGEPV